MNFSTVPPSASISVRIAENHVSITSLRASESSSSPSPVEPVTFANITAGRSSSGAAQAPQKRKPSGFSWPQAAQTGMTQAYASGTGWDKVGLCELRSRRPSRARA